METKGVRETHLLHNLHGPGVTQVLHIDIPLIKTTYLHGLLCMQVGLGNVVQVWSAASQTELYNLVDS